VEGETLCLPRAELLFGEPVDGARGFASMDNVQNKNVVVVLEKIEDILGKGASIYKVHSRLRPILLGKVVHCMDTNALVGQEEVANAKNKELLHITALGRVVVGRQKGAGWTGPLGAKYQDCLLVQTDHVFFFGLSVHHVHGTAQSRVKGADKPSNVHRIFDVRYRHANKGLFYWTALPHVVTGITVP
jgi:hypothetical protein